MVDYENKPVKEWIKLLKIEWSFDLDNQIYNPYEEEKFYHEDTKFIIGWVNLDEFFKSMLKMHQLKGGDIWRDRFKNKINGVIDFWKKGGKMTPPLIDTSRNCSSFPISNANDCIVIRAGYHRFSVCCLVGLDEIPFITPEKSKNDIEKKLPTVRWI